MHYETRCLQWLMNTFGVALGVGILVIAVFMDWAHSETPANGLVIVAAAILSTLVALIGYRMGTRRMPGWLLDDPATRRMIENVLAN